MENRKMPEEERIVAQKRSRRVWQRVVSLLACVVVFCTTYALILPAITMERAAVCGREEHSHIEECFDVADPSVLICALEEHTHTDECRTGGETTPSTENIPVQTTETIPQITEANRETEAAGDLVVSDEGVGLLSVIEADNPVVLNAGVEGVSYPDFETEMNGLDKLKLSENVSIWIRETDAWRESGEGTGVGGYQFWTGQAATINIAIGSNENSTYRLYFQFTKAGGGLDVSPEENGGAYTFHGQPITCKATEDPNTVYLEFTPAAGVTAAIPIKAWYSSPGSAGGGLKVWGENVSAGTTSDEIQFSWHSQTYPFVLGASIDTYSSSAEMIVGFLSENRGILPKNPIYIMTMESTADPAVTCGRNYAKETIISAYLDMPAGFSWDVECKNAIENAKGKRLYGKPSYSNGRCYTFYAKEKPIASFEVQDREKDFLLEPFNPLDTNLQHDDAWVTWDSNMNRPLFHCRVSNTSGKEMAGGGEKYIGTDGKEYTVQRQVRFIVCKDALTIVTNDETENLGFNEITEERSPLMCHFEAVVNYAHDNITADPNSDMNADLAAELKTEKAIDIPKAVPRLSFGRSVIYPTYFGESFCDTLTLENYGTVDWLAGNTAVQTVYQQMRYGMYITPENMEKMFQEEYGKELTIEITNATLGEWQEVTGTDGKTTVYLHPGNTYHPNANSEEPRYRLTINYNDETGLYQVAIAEYPDNTHCKTVTGNSVEEVLRKAGYGVTEADTYHFRWAQNEEGSTLQLVPGETRTFHIYTDFKDTFENLTSDNPGQYPNEKIDVRSNYAFFTTGGSTMATWHFPGAFYREASLSKRITKADGTVLEGQFKVKAGDVLDHQITLTNAGTGVYENLPIVDEIYGTQYLLAPVIDENAHLADMELDTHGDFYVLNKAGTYENVCVGVDEEGNYLNAATITVSALSADHDVGEALSYGGVHTQIKWYFAQTNDVSIRYETLVPQELPGSYSIGGTTWANDRVGARLHTSMWGGGSVIGHDKAIVLEKGENPEQDVLADYSVVKPGDQVTYRLTLRSEEAGTIALSGVNMADNLPDTFGLFDWVKGGNISEISVSIPEDKAGKITCTEQLTTEWSVGDSYGSLPGEGARYILWTDKAAITFTEPGEVYLYYTLTYPGGAGEDALWEQYVDTVNGNRVQNAFYVYRNAATVEHDLWVTGKVLLQKGVADTYIIAYHAYNANSRQYFNNADSFGRQIAYYVTLYNGGNKRLYLNDMKDKLPAGTTFIKCIYDANRLVNNPITTVGGTELGALPLIQTILPEDASKVVFRSAAVSGTAADGIATFTFGKGTGDYAVSYDSARGQYYLNQNEAIVFGYLVNVGKAAETGEELTNTIAMAYTDYSGTGVEVVSGDKIEVKAAPSDYYPDYNDGDCRVLSAQQVQEAYGLTSEEQQNWLVSQVTSTKGEIAPGVTKHTESYVTGIGGGKLPYTDSVGPFDTVNWRVRVYNTGTAAMTDFTLTDILPYPYVIEGEMKCTVYSQHEYNGTTTLREHICTFPTNRTGEESELTVFYNIASFNPSCTVIFGREPEASIYYYLLGLKRESGNECVTLDFQEGMLSIPENCYMDVEFSARNPTGNLSYKVFTNRVVLTPDEKQTFGAGDVQYGRVVHNADGKAVSVENTALVTVNGAFSTNSANAVTGNANTDDSATSSDMVRSITLANPEETFTYTLSVENNAERPMTKLVMIDTLPQLEDTSPFDTYVKRDSEFTVELAGNPSFKVQVTAEDGTVTILNPDQYSLEYSIATDFGGGHSDDWKGKDTGKWNASAAEARAIRIIIEDEGGTLIPDGATVSVSFDVKAADPEAVKPGQTAWNTFGYHYAIKVNSITTELEAMPLEVGVTIPQEWKLQKKLVDPEGKPTMTSGEVGFTFLLYEGEPLAESFASKEEWITALTDAGRPYGEFTATVPAGSSESQPVLLDWTWKTGASYTLVEMPVGDGYRTESLGGSTGNSHTFRYDPKRAVTMECVNVLEHWSIHLTKTDEKGKVLPGAVFALYSPNLVDKIQIPQKYGELNISVTQTRGEDTWYLADVSESDEDGQILWDALLRDSYLVLEVKAPAGYKLPDSEGELVYRSSAVGLVKELTVVNYSGYELPETGGVGTGIFTILGLGLTGISGILGILTRRRKKR